MYTKHSGCASDACSVCYTVIRHTLKDSLCSDNKSTVCYGHMFMLLLSFKAKGVFQIPISLFLFLFLFLSLSLSLSLSPPHIQPVRDNDARLPSTIKHLSVEYPIAKTRLQSICEAIRSLVLQEAGGRQTIVFANTKVEADNIVASKILQSLPTSPKTLHGGMGQGARQATIRQFREGRIDVLVATDVASRGLDVQGVDLVIHSAFPEDFDSFVHRAGRTGRAGRPGTSVLLHSPSKKVCL